MNSCNNCTFVIPFRLDSPERQRNLTFTLGWLAPLKVKIILLEADTISKIDKRILRDNVEYHFVKDSNPVFHRTHYINTLLKKAATEVVSVWDTDVVTSHQQIVAAIHNILKGCTLAFPYNGDYVMLSPECSDEFIESGNLMYLEEQKFRPIFNRPFCGGAYFVNRQRYLSLGGENEHFTGWGPEDAERLRRVQIMGHQVKWTEKGEAYHLYHPRKENSRFFNEDAAIEMREELIKICSMTKEELTEYINVLYNERFDHMDNFS